MGSGLCILVVDDHRDTGILLRRLLHMADHTVVVTESCADALAVAATLQFDCYLLDIGLPDGDGCDLLRQLLARRAVPAAALTGYGAPEDRDRAIAAGFSEILVKPFKLADVQHVLARFAETPRPPTQPPPSDPPTHDGEWLAQ